LGHLKKYKTTGAAADQFPSSAEAAQSSAESRIGTRISFVSQEPQDLVSLPLNTSTSISASSLSLSSSAAQQDSLPTSASGFVSLSSPLGSALSLPSKIRRQDTFGDEFYESWERGVSVEKDRNSNRDSLLEDEDGNLSFSSPALASAGGQKRHRDEEEDENEEEEHEEGVASAELRSEMEKWKRLAGELQEQVVHLRAATAPSLSQRKSDAAEQSQSKKIKKGQRYHDYLLSQSQSDSQRQGQPEGQTQEGQGEARRQSKATPPPKPKKAKGKSG
jgi:hypothetical protein